jgi:excisionase family DNA binding protein
MPRKRAVSVPCPDTLQLPLEPLTVRIPVAMQLVGIGRSKFYELIASGDIETIKIGRCTLIPTASLRRLIGRAREGRL